MSLHSLILQHVSSKTKDMIFPKRPIPLWLHPRKLTRLCNNRFYLVYLQIPPVVQKCLLELLIFQTKIKSKFLNCIWSLCFFGFIQNMTSIFSSWHWLFEEISQLSCRDQSVVLHSGYVWFFPYEILWFDLFLASSVNQNLCLKGRLNSGETFLGWTSQRCCSLHIVSHLEAHVRLLYYSYNLDTF